MLTIHSVGNINNTQIWQYGSPSHSCENISLKITNVMLLLALEEKSGDHQSQ